jgi:hypothetical protein
MRTRAAEPGGRSSGRGRRFAAESTCFLIVVLIVLSVCRVGVAEAEQLRLYGVVLGAEGGGVAYLGDPQTGRVRGFRVGEVVGNQQVVAIAADRVVLRDGSDTVELRLSGGSPSNAAVNAPSPPPAAVAMPVEAVSPGRAATALPCPPLSVELPQCRRR